MADEKKVVSECEYKEVNGTENQQDAEAPKADTKPAEEKKEKKGVPKWLKTVGQVIEGAAAVFGAVIGGLLIFDKATEKRRKAKYDAWKQSQQQTMYTPVQPTTFQQEFHNEESQN